MSQELSSWEPVAVFRNGHEQPTGFRFASQEDALRCAETILQRANVSLGEITDVHLQGSLAVPNYVLTDDGPRLIEVKP